MIKKIDGCVSDNVKAVFKDLYDILSGVLAYDILSVSEEKEEEKTLKFSVNYYYDEIRNISFLASDNCDLCKLKKEEIIDYICYFLLSGKDHPLGKKSASAVKNYGNPNDNANPSSFFTGYRIEEEGVTELTDALYEVLNMSMDEFKQSPRNRAFAEKYNKAGTDDLKELFRIVSEHLAALINEESFMPSETDERASETIFNENKPKSNVYNNSDLIEDNNDRLRIEQIRSIKNTFPYLADIQYYDRSFSTVYKAKDLNRQMDVAVKLYPSATAFQIPLFINHGLFWDIKNNSDGMLISICYDPIGVIMKFIDGVPLDKHITHYIFGESKTILFCMISILSGLEKLHKKNIYYGDLTPQNIIIDRHHKAWLCDFSEANYSGTKGVEHTVLIGYAYRSPEKMCYELIDHRSDIYEFGMILSDYISAFKFNDDLYHQIFRVIQKCTKNKPDDRYQSVSEIKEELSRISSDFNLS